MTWSPVVSVQLVELGACGVVWATAEENGAAGTRWSLWLAGKRLTIRGAAGAAFEWTSIPDAWATARLPPLRAARSGDDAYTVTFPFAKSTHIGSASGTTRLTIYPRTLTVHESNDVVVALHDTNANATATNVAAWPPKAPPPMPAAVRAPQRLPHREVDTSGLGFRLERDDDADTETLRALLDEVRQAGTLVVERWTLHAVRETVSDDDVARAIARAIDARALFAVGWGANQITRADAEDVAGRFLARDIANGSAAMNADDARALASLFVSRFSDAARFYFVEASDGDTLEQTLVAIEADRAGVLRIVDAFADDD